MFAPCACSRGTMNHDVFVTSGDVTAPLLQKHIPKSVVCLFVKV